MMLVLWSDGLRTKEKYLAGLAGSWCEVFLVDWEVLGMLFENEILTKTGAGLVLSDY